MFKSFDYSIKCNSYALGKSRKLSYPHYHESATKMFDLIYVDLWTFPIVAFISANYFLLIMDDLSNLYGSIFFLTKVNPNCIKHVQSNDRKPF